MTSEQDPDTCINDLRRRRNLLNGMEEPITGRHVTDFALQGLTEEYRDRQQGVAPSTEAANLGSPYQRGFAGKTFHGVVAKRT